MVLLDLQDILARAGQTLENFNMPAPQGLDIPMNTNKELERETRYEREVERTKADARRLQTYPSKEKLLTKSQDVWTQKSQEHSSLMAPEVAAKLFFTRHCCTMSGVKD